MRQQKYINRQLHLHLRSREWRDSRLTQVNLTGRYGRRCWTNIFSAKFLHVPLGNNVWPLGYEERRCWTNCYHSFQDFRPTWSMVMIHQRHRRTDRRTDDMRSEDRSSHGKNPSDIPEPAAHSIIPWLWTFDLFNASVNTTMRCTRMCTEFGVDSSRRHCAEHTHS